MGKFRLKTGFTLAEALIAMAIIGVVMALLLRALNRAQPDKEKMMYSKSYHTLETVVYETINDYTKDVIDTSSNLPEQIGSFHLDVIECDGHNIEELEKAFRQETTKPKCIVAHTIKGKECQFVLATKDFGYFHGAAFTEEELKETQEAINNEYAIK